MILTDIITNTISNILSNLAWFILVIWAVKTIVKNMPKWISEYERIKLHERVVNNALGKRARI